ncbi:M20 family metallo-hydrolase [Alkalicoccus halolimnae]|uniref:M20 family metallo-hydrolase n=1 Tax=Alkalicoccus halolimnae TaxID=1667239 RepID=A0A5C7FKN1_9BACI|nr:M20 family metallo-hydrolase [Alkalicoccus halolimnae]TXF85916.1 M20 family metallo-hydrolase [Alkalicoccus halolimnae]
MENWLKEKLLELNAVSTMEQPEGFNRLSFTEKEREAQEAFKKVALELGMKLRADSTGNIIARLETEDQQGKPAIALGSHLDTVKNGGGYDGAAGVLCALGAVKMIRDSKEILPFPVEVICFASEESSRFSMSTVGSKAMTGQLTEEQLNTIKDENGSTLAEAMTEFGLDPAKFKEAERGEEELLSFTELHIEQGTRIEDAGCDYGTVSAIACPIRMHLHVNGKAGHTGTTPMDQRQDALVDAAEIITFVHEAANCLNENDDFPIVATVSTIEASPNAMNIIPGFVKLGVDIRSVSDKQKNLMEKAVDTYLKKYRPSVEKEILVRNPSVQLDRKMYGKMKTLGHQTGLKSFEMESGAGHDVMNMQKKWPSGLIFIPCRDGLSHHPEEYASPQDLLKGTRLLHAHLTTSNSG